MFKKILIANRGEIACRVAATARRLGVRTVAVYSDADAQAKHVAACDEAVHIGGSAPKDSYLQWQRVIDAAKATGAEAIHPGYGFLSENEAFADACKGAGLVFIGPSADSIRAMGLKAESKRLMESAGVPLVPGYHGEDQDPALLQREADRIGYPALIKASAGGGGKGMRVVERSEDFAAALASCQREARNSFGSDAVLIEKYVQRPRHIEIQVFGDSHGNVIHLFERDCSVQRRHQKVLEEAPAPGMTPELRAEMGAAAVAAAKAVNYVGAGTVEFIVEQVGGYGLGVMPGADAGPPQVGSAPSGGSDPAQRRSVGAQGADAGPPQVGAAPSGGSDPAQRRSVGARFFFMEMNARLQVEHPVTEAVTGLDLVEWQLRVAGGESLPLLQEEVTLTGHAIEARICAETPDKQFLPATGELQVYRSPIHSAFERGVVRVDSGVREGDAISPFYDSMIAKLIVHGNTREEALARLDAALTETHIVGVSTNVQFLRRVVHSAAFAQAELDTALIQREASALFHHDPVGESFTVAAAVAQTLIQESAATASDPFSRRDGWRMFGQAERRFDFSYHGSPLTASLVYLHGGGVQLKVGSHDEVLSYHLLPSESGIRFDLQYAGRRQTVHTWQRGETVHVFCGLGASVIDELDVLAHAGERGSEGGRLSAPMPGKVLSFAVKAGDAVKAGQVLAVMEAMKMEHTIAAPTDGVVTELLFSPGDQVGEGDDLLRLETVASEAAAQPV
ncbi:acetyl/propionyl/methylcrotonyl-CoA carboxylase subunit alpha [Hydrogenophaga sp. 5NK40-0174]|uniref:acetyl/propionyl/methylcrotonyl-CoA carboxylase subunit alpha n=1 Tax=Hydrogenophaga sp. 5NK40-0174 TaxID=3127649 RepID=UPI003104D61B